MVRGMGITVCDHPLARHLITEIRRRETTPAQFRTLAEHLTLVLALEATRDLPLNKRTVETPMETAEGAELTLGIAAIPILRAGLSMVSPITNLFPDVSVGYIGMERDEETAIARPYYCKLPRLENRVTLVLDPMLATGGTASQSIDAIKKWGGARDIRLLSLVAAPEGAERVENDHPDVMIFVAAMDRELNAQKFILPGLGDFGDRLYGTQ